MFSCFSRFSTVNKVIPGIKVRLIFRKQGIRQIKVMMLPIIWARSEVYLI